MKTFALMALFAGAGVLHAEGMSYDVSGATVGKAENQYIPLGDSHMYIDLNSKFTMPDNGTPVAGMTGNCMGAMQVTMGAGAQGNGMCIWTDGDGDSWFGPWNVVGMTPERATAGTWYVSGGTGKFAGASGGGTFTSLTNPENGDSKLDVLGSLTMN
ncbi:MAG: hypothetical protein OIF48_06680 [Silicimonas sp.]|nr:hypothetical protein [Silicimonas sp.]